MDKPYRGERYYETLPEKSTLEHRYYETPPEKITLIHCYYHGSDHRAYGWLVHIDPRWSEEQVAAYRRGYAGENF